MADADFPGKLANILAEWRILFSSSGREKANQRNLHSA